MSKNNKLIMTTPLKGFDAFIKEEFIAVGFGTPTSSASWSTAGLRGGDTGYSMQPIAGRIKDLATGIAQQGLDYEGNENPKHSGTEYIKEAKKHIGDAIDESYESMSVTSESEAVTEEYVETLDGDGDILKGLLTIQGTWEEWKDGPLTKPSDIKPAAKELKYYILSWLNKNLK